MNMQMSLQILRPGVQQQSERPVGNQPARVGGELGERACGVLSSCRLKQAGPKLRSTSARVALMAQLSAWAALAVMAVAADQILTDLPMID